MKINIHALKDGISIQQFYALNAYKQSLDSDYVSDWTIKITNDFDSKSDVNILFSYITNKLDIKIQKYNVVFFCNGGEPLSVMTQLVKDLLDYDHVYLIANSYLDETHPFKSKVICNTHNLQLCKDFWFRKFYPTYYEASKNSLLKRLPTIGSINGENRTTRAYFFELLDGTLTHSRQTYSGNTVIKTLDSFFESKEDFDFIMWLEEYYKHNLVDYSDSYTYYDNAVTVGIDESHGTINPGYFALPMYYQHSCIVFPESTYQNNELPITEKSLKCFFAGSLPFPVGGANINKLYNKVGFQTAWNLLPEDLQKFDSVLDHNQRYHGMVSAIQWLHQNKKVFQSKEFDQTVEINYNNLISPDIDIQNILNLIEIIERHK